MASLFATVAPGAVGRVIHQGSSIIVEPPKTCDSVVVIMHGLGDTANGFADVAQMFSPKLPTTRFVLPTAPENPVTLNGGMVMTSWYDIVGLTNRASEHCEGIEDSVKTIEAILDAEHAKGIPYNRMALAGFSQGGAMGLFVGLQLEASKKLAGLLVMSGYLAGSAKFTLTPEMKDLKVLHQHGTADPLVQFTWAEQTRDALLGMGLTNYKLEPYREMVHTVRPEELESGLKFLMEILPPKESAPLKAIAEMSVGELKAAIQKAGLGEQAAGLLEKKDYVELLEKNFKNDEL